MFIKKWVENNTKQKRKFKIQDKGVVMGMKNIIHADIKTSLDKISSQLKVLNGENGMIKLDKNNPSHVDWFEDDDE